MAEFVIEPLTAAPKTLAAFDAFVHAKFPAGLFGEINAMYPAKTDSDAPAALVQPAPRRSVLCAPRHVPVPPVPIPASWYNADYFEHGLTSNWKNGYQWDQFQGLFRDTASFVVESFPGASSFLDAG